MNSCNCELYIDGKIYEKNLFSYPFSQKDVINWYQSLKLPSISQNPLTIIDNKFPLEITTITADKMHKITFCFPIICPICQSSKLQPQLTHKIDGYICPKCNAVFDARKHICESNPLITIYYACHRSPQHMDEPTSWHIEKNSELSHLLEELLNLTLHDNIYIFYVTKQ